MAVPGLAVKLPDYSRGARPRQSRSIELPKTPAGPRARFKPPAWMMHDMKPIEPYNGGARSKAVGVGGGSPSRGAAHHKGTGDTPQLTVRLTSGPEESYKPSFGDPKRENRKKGYFNDPDIIKAGHRNQFYDSGGVNVPVKKQHVLSRFEQTHVKPPEKLVLKSKDGIWKKPDEVAMDCAINRVVKEEFVKEMASHKKEVAKKQLEAERAKQREKDEWVAYDPYKPELPSFFGREYRNHDSIENYHSRSRLKSTVGFSEALKPEDQGKVLPAHTRVHRDRHVPGTRYDWVPDRIEEHHREVAQEKAYGVELTQMKEERRRRDASALRKDKNHAEMPLVLQVHKPGCGAANRNPDGTVNTRLAGQLDQREKRPPDHKLAKTLEKQVVEQARARETDQHPAREDPGSKWDPFTRARVISSSDGKRPMFATAERALEGHSLLNTMGKPGGGAKSSKEGNVVSSFADEEYRIELEGQRAGNSPWGKAGAGAPLRTKSGKVVTHLRNVAEGDVTGTSAVKTDPNFKVRLERVRKDQERYMQQKKEWKETREKAERVETERIRAEPQLTDLMKGNTHRPHVGLRDSQMPDADPVFDPAGPAPKSNSAKRKDKDRGAELLREVAARKAAEKKRKEDERKADQKHVTTVRKKQDSARKREKERKMLPMHAYDTAITATLSPENQLTKKDPASKQGYAKDLDKALKRQAKVRKYNRMRQLKEDSSHMKSANKFLETTPARFVRQANGEKTARRHLPTGDHALEYRMLAPSSLDLG